MSANKIAIDFAGVICDMKHIPKGKKLGPPMEGAIDALQDLFLIYDIIIYTTIGNSPGGRKAVADWLEYYDIDYTEISGKPAASYYIDDNAVKFSSWKQTRKAVGLNE